MRAVADVASYDSCSVDGDMRVMVIASCCGREILMKGGMVIAGCIRSWGGGHIKGFGETFDF